MNSSAMPEKPPVDSDGKIIGDLPWKFFEPSRDTPTAGDWTNTSGASDESR